MLFVDWFAVTMSRMALPSKSTSATADGPEAPEVSGTMVFGLAGNEPLVFTNTLTVPDPLLAVTISGLPSPLRSPTASATGPRPNAPELLLVLTGVADGNVPVPELVRMTRLFSAL